MLLSTLDTRRLGGLLPNCLERNLLCLSSYLMPCNARFIQDTVVLIASSIEIYIAATPLSLCSHSCSMRSAHMSSSREESRLRRLVFSCITMSRSSRSLAPETRGCSSITIELYLSRAHYLSDRPNQ